MVQKIPLEQIMGMLRQSGAVDPAHSAQMMSGMQVMQGNLGANIPQTGAPGAPGASGAPLPDKPSPEEGTETDMTTPATAIPIIIDGLNESIIALKAEIHRTTEPEGRKQLERLAGQLRKHIQELGGEPIWADESIEEGLSKLTGHGYVAQSRVEDLTGGQVGGLQGVMSQLGTEPYQGAYSNQMGVYQRHPYSGGVGSKPAADSNRVQGYYVQQKPIQMGEFNDRLSEMLKQIGGASFGGGGGVSGPPGMTVSPEYVNELLESMGVKPRTPEEIAEHARLSVERMKLSKEQIIQREMDRFEREQPPAYAKAQADITRAAEGYAAEDQEEYASRGMFYSSIMASAVQDRKAMGMEQINEIANSAASYVMDLEAQMRDISEWAVLEEEVLRRELEAEDMNLRKELVNIKLQVGMWADQMALDAWYQQQSLNLQQQQVNLQAAQMRVQAAAQLGDQYAAAFMVNDPNIRKAIYDYGYTDAALNSMSLPQLAGLAQAAMTGLEFGLGREMNLLQAQLLATELTLGQQQIEHTDRFLNPDKYTATTTSKSKTTATKKAPSLTTNLGALAGQQAGRLRGIGVQ